MSEPYLGQIEAYAFNFAPRGWLMCDGQLLPIQQYQSLYSLLGTTYGGDGRTTFALPDLRGRTSLNFGDGAGLTNRTIGEKSGQETVSLNVGDIPSHTHTASGSNEEAGSTTPGGNVPATTAVPIYQSTPNTAMNANMIGLAGGGQPHNNMQPYLVLNWCICIEGLFPPRN